MRRRNRARTRGVNDHATDVAEQTINPAPAGTEKQSAISVRNRDIWLERAALDKEPGQEAPSVLVRRMSCMRQRKTVKKEV